MDIPANLLPQSYLWIAGFLYACLLITSLWTAPWSKIRDNEAQHIYLGVIVSLSLLWFMRGGIQDGLSFHLLGMTLLCLMFEWQFALMAASLIVMTLTIQGNAGWDALALNILLMGALPVLFTRAALYLGQRFLAHNYFIYVFVNAFLAGAISLLLAASASAAIQHFAGVHAPGTISNNFMQIIPMLMFGEAFLNGGVMTVVVVFRPQWVATFYDRWYLQDK